MGLSAWGRWVCPHSPPVSPKKMAPTQRAIYSEIHTLSVNLLRKNSFSPGHFNVGPYKSGDHLSKCLVYIDLNMVRAGVVKHPSEWAFCGYNEIQEPKRKKVLINYQRLTELLGFNRYDEVQTYHKRWVDDYLENGKNTRDEKWTMSIAVGNRSFVERVKSLMGALAIGRKSTEVGDSY